jgi:hypothetical protein
MTLTIWIIIICDIVAIITFLWMIFTLPKFKEYEEEPRTKTPKD